ncbi:MAG: hypothetical protein AB1529_01240 [Candidatus Micrarchaeota archaeon]
MEGRLMVVLERAAIARADERRMAVGAMQAAPLAEGILKKCPIAISRGFGAIDTGRARELIESSFAKPLAQGYFETHAELVMLAGHYDGIAVVKRVGGAPYLDKLAVAPHAQGTGVGKALWECIKDAYDSLIWRTSLVNEHKGWYRSDGSVESGKWLVFWNNLPPEEVARLVPLVAAMPETILRNGGLGT